MSLENNIIGLEAEREFRRNNPKFRGQMDRFETHRYHEVSEYLRNATANQKIPQRLRDKAAQLYFVSRVQVNCDLRLFYATARDLQARIEYKSMNPTKKLRFMLIDKTIGFERYNRTRAKIKKKVRDLKYWVLEFERTPQHDLDNSFNRYKRR